MVVGAVERVSRQGGACVGTGGEGGGDSQASNNNCNVVALAAIVDHI